MLVRKALIARRTFLTQDSSFSSVLRMKGLIGEDEMPTVDEHGKFITAFEKSREYKREQEKNALSSHNLMDHSLAPKTVLVLKFQTVKSKKKGKGKRLRLT